VKEFDNSGIEPLDSEGDILLAEGNRVAQN
jgi:hypothetical protein